MPFSSHNRLTDGQQQDSHVQLNKRIARICAVLNISSGFSYKWCHNESKKFGTGHKLTASQSCVQQCLIHVHSPLQMVKLDTCIWPFHFFLRLCQLPWKTCTTNLWSFFFVVQDFWSFSTALRTRRLAVIRGRSAMCSTIAVSIYTRGRQQQHISIVSLTVSAEDKPNRVTNKTYSHVPFLLRGSSSAYANLRAMGSQRRKC